MTPLLKTVKRIAEKWFGVWEEGPEPPARLRQVADIFARANPRATVAEWAAFAAEHAELAYRQGYARGWERYERLGPDWEEPDALAGVLERFEQAEAGNDVPFDPNAVVPIDGVPRDGAARIMLTMSEAHAEAAGHRRGPAR